MVDLSTQGLSGLFNIRNYITGNTISIIYTTLIWIFGIVILFLLFWYLYWIPRRYKDVVEIWELTNAGIRTSYDRGYWKIDRKDGVGYYNLKGNKKARLKQPNQEFSLLTKKGNILYRFLKFGVSPFDYAQLIHDAEAIDKNFKENIEISPLSDQDWTKMQIKREMEKKNSGFWNENKQIILASGIFIFCLLTVMWIIGFANDTLKLITSQTSQNLETQKQIATSLNNVANALSTHTSVQNGGVVNPPI